MNARKTLVADYIRDSAQILKTHLNSELIVEQEQGIQAKEEEAQERLSQGDILGVLWLLSSGKRLDFVVDNAQMLKERGLFERGLLEAWTSANINIRSWSPTFTNWIFGKFADRDRLRAAGQPLPGEGPFTLYRGVAGRGPARRVRGISWTASMERARWFANWYADRFRLENPCIYRTSASQEHVLACSNDRQEDEFLVLLPSDHEVTIHERLASAPAERT